MRTVQLLAAGLAALVLAGACASTTDDVAPTSEPAALDRPTPTFAPTTTVATADPARPVEPVADEEPPAPAGTVQELIAALPVAPESTGAAYSRHLFGGSWIDADGDGCDTRCEVLRASRLPQLPGLPGGGWRSSYDGYTTDDPTELDIDHLVPLAEAWRSGAADWDGPRRLAFANDLDHPGALVAVTAATNRSKGDKDPAAWQPPNLDAWCDYVTAWVTTKLRWGLTADEAEVRALTNMATSRGCEPDGG